MRIDDLTNALLTALREEGSVDDADSDGKGTNTDYPGYYMLHGSTNLRRVAERIAGLVGFQGDKL